MQLLVELFAGDLGGEQAFAGVRHLVFGIHPRTFGHHRGKCGLHFRHPVAGQRRNEIDVGKIDLASQFLGQRQKRFLLRCIDLVEDEDLAFGPRGDLFDQRFQFVAALLDRIDQQQDGVGCLGAFPGRADHRAVEPALGREDTGRIDQDHLRIAVQRDAHHPRPRGLRLGRGDRDLLANELVDQRALARVGRA